ncbi:MAG: GIY-YIG nuclease family protein [Pseudomonadota bacterium]
MTYFVYILASQKNGTLYIGVTNDIARRTFEHRNDEGAVFTRKYQVHRLVYYEPYDRIDEAITREKQMKKWNRQWKINLIETMNPDWDDLYLKLNH